MLDVDEPTTFESSIIRARPDSAKTEPLFLYYFFNSTAGLHCLDTIRRQVAVAGITGSDLSRLEIPIPPLPVQRAIAHILGTLDDKIELNRRMNETLEAMARAIFRSWFVDFDPVRAKAEGCDPGLPKHIADLFPDRFEDSDLGEIPAGWGIRACMTAPNTSMGRTFETSISHWTVTDCHSSRLPNSRTVRNRRKQNSRKQHRTLRNDDYGWRYPFFVVSCSRRHAGLVLSLGREEVANQSANQQGFPKQAEDEILRLLVS